MLAAAFDLLPIALLVLAADGTALTVNQAWSELSGQAVDDSRGYGWLEAIDASDRAVLRALVQDSTTTGRAGSAKLRLILPGLKRWSHWSWRPGPAGRLFVTAVGLGVNP